METSEKSMPYSESASSQKGKPASRLWLQISSLSLKSSLGNAAAEIPLDLYIMLWRKIDTPKQS